MRETFQRKQCCSGEDFRRSNWNGAKGKDRNAELSPFLIHFQMLNVPQIFMKVPMVQTEGLQTESSHLCYVSWAPGVRACTLFMLSTTSPSVPGSLALPVRHWEAGVRGACSSQFWRPCHSRSSLWQNQGPITTLDFAGLAFRCFLTKESRMFVV